MLKLKGLVKIGVRDRHSGKTRHYEIPNATNFGNLCGANSSSGLFGLIATGALPSAGSPVPTKLVLEMGLVGGGTAGDSVYGLGAGDVAFNITPNTTKAWGSNTNWDNVKAYPMKAEVVGSTITFTMYQFYDSGNQTFDDAMLPVPVNTGLDANPLGRREVKAVRLVGGTVNQAASSYDVASVSGSNLPSTLYDSSGSAAIPIHNYSDISLSYSLSLADDAAETAANFGGFTQCYLNRLARIIAGESTTSLASNSAYGGSGVVGTVSGAKITSAAVFGAATNVTTYTTPAGGLSNSATVLNVVLDNGAINSTLGSGEKVFWLSDTNEKVQIQTNPITGTGSTNLNIMRGVHCTSKQAIAGNTTGYLQTRPKLSFVNSGGWSGKINYYASHGSQASGNTNWESDFNVLTSRPYMIEYYTRNDSSQAGGSEWDHGDTDTVNLADAREIAARFPVDLESRFTSGDRLVINNYLGISE